MQDSHACDMGACGKDACKCMHHKAVPILIVLIGLAFLLGALNVVSAYTVSVIWPILLIMIGMQKMCKGMCKCCQPKA